jgi:hypothetical protein
LKRTGARGIYISRAPPIVMADEQLAVRSGVYFCETGCRLVFLDLARDRYFCLTAKAEAAFRELAAGSALGALDRRIIDQLLEEGLLIGSTGCMNQLDCAQSPAPATGTLRDHSSAGAIGVTAHAALRLAQARLLLRCRSLDRIVKHIAQRKRRLSRTAEDAHAVAGEIGAAFERTSFLLAPLDQCLPRAIALAHALIDRKVRPQLVIGVKLRPFAAHCWVQHGQMLVTDDVDHVRTFTPIVAV